MESINPVILKAVRSSEFTQWIDGCIILILIVKVCAH